MKTVEMALGLSGNAVTGFLLRSLQVPSKISNFLNKTPHSAVHLFQDVRLDARTWTVLILVGTFMSRV